MAVGFPIDRGVIDNRCGFLAKQLRDTLAQIATVKAFLDATTDADLIAMGYSQDDVTLLKSAYGDLAKLSRIAHGQDTQADASDFFWFAKRLVGLD